jgi:hypothetical protein
MEMSPSSVQMGHSGISSTSTFKLLVHNRPGLGPRCWIRTRSQVAPVSCRRIGLGSRSPGPLDPPQTSIRANNRIFFWRKCLLVSGGQAILARPLAHLRNHPECFKSRSSADGPCLTISQWLWAPKSEMPVMCLSDFVQASPSAQSSLCSQAKQASLSLTGLLPLLSVISVPCTPFLCWACHPPLWFAYLSVSILHWSYGCLERGGGGGGPAFYDSLDL